LKHGPLSVTSAIGWISPLTGSLSDSASGRPVSRSLSAIACSTVSIASRWFYRVETCQASSSFDQ
jgi:hypothetical protein